ncbi:MAG: MFS transporter [Gammaproteobacteria bacterium]|nr:MFS transporter [Gammaproteobacteria bacterium]
MRVPGESRTRRRLSDRRGRKRVLLIGLFGFAAGTVLFNSVLHAGLAGMLTGTMLFASLVLARMCHAGLMAASMPAASAYMADITDAANRTKGMGAAGAANNLGAILGPAVAGLAFISLLTPLWVMAGVALLNGLFVWRFLPEPPRPAADAEAASARSPEPMPRLKYLDARILPFVVVGVTMFTGMALVQQTMGFRFQDALVLNAEDTAQAVAVAMMSSAVCSLIAQGLVVQRLSLPPFTLLRLAMPLLIVAFTMMALSEARWALTLAMMVQRHRRRPRRARLHGRGLAGGLGARAGRRCRDCRLLRSARVRPGSAPRRCALPVQPDPALCGRRGHVHAAVPRPCSGIAHPVSRAPGLDCRLGRSPSAALARRMVYDRSGGTDPGGRRIGVPTIGSRRTGGQQIMMTGDEYRASLNDGRRADLLRGPAGRGRAATAPCSDSAVNCWRPPALDRFHDPAPGPSAPSWWCPGRRAGAAQGQVQLRRPSTCSPTSPMPRS